MRQRLHVDVDVAVVAAKRLGQRVPALKRDMTCLDRLALLNAVPRVNEREGCVISASIQPRKIRTTAVTIRPRASPVSWPTVASMIS